jgi:hypothetical protein
MNTLTKIISICLVFSTFFACNETPKGALTDKVDSQNSTDSLAITEVVHNFYKWYASDTTSIDYIDSKGEASKLDTAKLNAYHAQMMSSGFISKAYIDNDMAYLKKYEAIWQENKENAKEGPLSGKDADNVFCGQDWDEKAYTSGVVEIVRLGTNQVNASIETSKLELVKENEKWLIAKITCE